METKINLLTTEMNNPNTVQLSEQSTQDMVRMIHAEDCKITQAIEQELPQIAKAIEAASERLAQGGRMFYFGAGTSGRLAVVDASECHCTYGVAPDLVQAVLAGGVEGILDASQGDEDDPELAKKEFATRHITHKDVIVGITASGRTPYVIGALQKGNEIGALTIGICNNKNSALSEVAQITIAPVTGPEVIEGSTRMKAGTSQKMILNMISTGVMVKLGKVYKNLMVNMVANNSKLYIRAVRMVCCATACSEEKAEEVLKQCDYEIKVAIVAILLDLQVAEARGLLATHADNIDDIMKGGVAK